MLISVTVTSYGDVLLAFEEQEPYGLVTAGFVTCLFTLKKCHTCLPEAKNFSYDLYFNILLLVHLIDL